MQRLTELNLHCNKLQALPDGLGQLQQLATLKLSDNALQQLPASMGQLRQLSSLDLSGNELQQLPDSLGKLLRLATLDLSRNALRALPASLAQAPLTRLALRSNSQLWALPPAGPFRKRCRTWTLMAAAACRRSPGELENGQGKVELVPASVCSVGGAGCLLQLGSMGCLLVLGRPSRQEGRRTKLRGHFFSKSRSQLRSHMAILSHDLPTALAELPAGQKDQAEGTLVFQK